MLEQYREALELEAGAWRALEVVARQQRQAIVFRQAGEVDTLRAELEAQLRLTLIAHHQSGRSRPQEAEALAVDWEQRVRRAQREAREALSLNRELLRDTCSYLEMIRCVTRPETAPVAYGPEHARRSRPTAAQSKVA